MIEYAVVRLAERIFARLHAVIIENDSRVNYSRFFLIRTSGDPKNDRITKSSTYGDSKYRGLLFRDFQGT